MIVQAIVQEGFLSLSMTEDSFISFNGHELGLPTRVTLLNCKLRFLISNDHLA